MFLRLASDGSTTNLTKFWAALRGEDCAGIAPERGAYSRIGACPYLSPQLINSRFCPCKGRISLAGLAPQHLSRYVPLTGARFINRLQEVGASPYPKYEPLSGALSPLYQPWFFKANTISITTSLHGAMREHSTMP